MNESSKIEKLKENCLKLFQLKDDFKKYETETIKIINEIGTLKLEYVVDPGQLRFFLIQPVQGKKLPELSWAEFRNAIEDYFMVKDTDYYFQIIELNNFPDNYRLGHGTLFTFASLPQLVKNAAISLSKREITNVQSSFQKVWQQIFEQLVIPADPNLGHWLKISCSSISWNVGLDKAFEYAEESLDILRIATSTARFHLPRHAIAWNAKKSEAYPLVKGIDFSKYPYNPERQNVIDRLNVLYGESSFELEERIKNAIHFWRIADNNSPNYQRLFFYAAAIEHLILGSNDRDILRWKFSEKGAILLSDNLKERLDLAKHLKDIYDARSETAHGEKSDYDFFLTTSCRAYLRRIIMKLIRLMDTHKLKTVVPKGDKSGESLDEYLENIIYSGIEAGAS